MDGKTSFRCNNKKTTYTKIYKGQVESHNYQRTKGTRNIENITRVRYRPYFVSFFLNLNNVEIKNLNHM